MNTLEFSKSQALSMGVELELQIVGQHDFDLVPQSADLLRQFTAGTRRWDIKPEMTTSMIEVSTSIQHRHDELLAELHEIRDSLCKAARFLNLSLCGGGTHAFQQWHEQQIFDAPRFHSLNDLYGYLAKQFTIFGQHVHLGCADGDTALWLLHALSRYVPHFIALSASSPYVQGSDTGFHSARLNSVFAFPLSGRAPFVTQWDAFNAYFDKMTSTGVVSSMKDFYWDIRPKPEYGTIELRVCDTPLTVDRAAALAVYLQSLASYLLEERPVEPEEDDYLVYTFNRFQACRFGLDGVIADPRTKRRISLRDDIRDTLARIRPHAYALGAEAGCAHIDRILFEGNDAQWLRGLRSRGYSYPGLVQQQARRWGGRVASMSTVSQGV